MNLKGIKLTCWATRLSVLKLRAGRRSSLHFGTFPVLTGTPGALQKLVPGVEVLEMKPGVTIGG
jgi:hypothetical protein